jgi:glycosyltransferase involved in cell wall biosynthesis
LASFLGKSKTKKISSGIIPNQKKQSFLVKTLLWVRGNIFIPDARFLWVKPSVKYLKKYLQENNIDTVVTSGPPHSLHLIGLQLKKELGVTWLADFRDPWTTIGYHKALKLSSYAEKKHKVLEKAVLTSADTIIVTSKTTKTEFEAITSSPIAVITNGYDVEKVTKQPLDEKFTLAHIGSFLSERNPRILWKALQELAHEHKGFAEDFQLKLIGAVSQEVLDTIVEFKLQDFVLNLGYVSHQEAVEHQRKSQVLLLIEIDSEDTKSIIPGKVFEYMVSERPIVAIGPQGSDFAEIISATNTGVFFTYDEKDKLKALFLKHYQDYKANNLKVNAVGLQQYSRKSLTEQLAKLLTPNS